MFFRWLLLLCLLPCSLQAAPDKARNDLSYSLGAKIGERLQEETSDIDLQALLDGLHDAYRNQPLRIPQARIDQLLDEHEEQLRQRALEQRDQKAWNAERVFLDKERAIAGTRELAGGILVRELRAGHGRVAIAGNRVRVSYRGELMDGSLVDQSEGPQWFPLDSLISGWRTALLEMPAGARWRMVIPAAQAYGSAGAGDRIPANATLVFDVDLLEVGN